jgi:hypothetical protein
VRFFGAIAASLIPRSIGAANRVAVETSKYPAGASTGNPRVSVAAVKNNRKTTQNMIC